MMPKLSQKAVCNAAPGSHCIHTARSCIVMLVRAVFGLKKVDFRRTAKLDEYLYCARRQTFALSHCVARGRVTEVL